MRVLLLVLALLVASPALAINEWTMCGGTPTASSKVGAGQCREFRFDSTCTGSCLNITFAVMTETALVEFAPDILAAGGTATAMVQTCISGATEDAVTCVDMLASALDGTGGAPATQQRAIRIGYGTYRVELTAAGAGDTAVLQVQGE